MFREISGQMPRSGKNVVSPTPNGLPPILRAAYAMKPDVIFLMSDGSFERGTETSEKVPEEEFEALFRELAPAGSAKISFNFIGFEMKDADKDFWNRMTRRQGGDFKEIK